MMLQGIKVLEYCHTVAGGSCARHLADLGAEVIKIEQPITGDMSRRRGPFPGDLPDQEKSGLYQYVNRNKMGITLDPTQDTGRDIFLDLVQRVDVLIEDNSPAEMVRMGLNPGEICKLRPNLVVTSITPFGQDGPYAEYKAYPLNVYHGGGVGHITPEGYQDIKRPPLKQGKYVSEYHGGIGAAIITLGTLLRARTHGIGGHIDFSQQEWEIGLLKTKWEIFSYQGMPVARNTVSRRGNSMTPCKDGYVIIILYEEHQWLRFIEVAGKDEWLLDERFADPHARADHGEALADLIADWAKDYTMNEIYHLCQPNGVPVGMVNKPADILASDQLEERGFFVEIDHPLTGTLRQPGVPYLLSSARLTYAPAPTLGQHNEEIYCGRLGFTKENLTAMRRVSVI
jgi:CoA:oxalate CoA-transferase